MTSTKQVERYPLASSPFHRMGRSVDLAELLQLSPKQLRKLLKARESLYYFKEECINGKNRSLAVPLREMRQVHERLKHLLVRISLPNYLYCPRRGRAPVDNALAHMDSFAVVKLDIKQFYPSTTDEHVFQFFHHRLGIVADVAGRLTKICTINGRVAFGSPLSPILCALVHDDIFSKAATLCSLQDNTITLWVDDLTISGKNVEASLVRDIHRLIESKRMRPHKAQWVRRRQGVVITGTFIGDKGAAPANKLHLKMKAKLAELEAAGEVGRQLSLVRSLIGLINHSMTIYAKGGEHHTRLQRRLMWLHNRRRQLEKEAATTTTGSIVHLHPTSEGGSIPWD